MKFAISLLACLVALSQYAEASHPTVVFRAQPLYDYGLQGVCSHLLRLPAWQIYHGNPRELLNEDRTKQYLRCYLGHLNLMSPDGKFNPNALAALIGEKYRHQITTCASLTQLATDPWELAFHLVRCFEEQNPEILRQIGLLPPLGIPIPAVYYY